MTTEESLSNEIKMLSWKLSELQAKIHAQNEFIKDTWAIFDKFERIGIGAIIKGFLQKHGEKR
jgi:hypothetical protein